MKVAAGMLALMLLVSVEARAQEISDTVLVEEPDTTVRLDAWLRFNANAEREARTVNWIGTSLLLTIGPLELVGAGLLSDASNTRVPAWLPSMLLTSGIFATAGGFVRLASQLMHGSDQRERYASYLRERDAGTLSDVRRMAYETQWRADVQYLHDVRQVAAIGSIGMCVTGGALMLVASQTHEDTFRMHDEFLGVGIALAATGCLNGPLMLLRTQAERNLDSYDEGMRIEAEDDLAVTVLPSVGANQVGLSVVGVF